MSRNIVFVVIGLALMASIVYILSLRNQSEIKFESFELMEKRDVEGFGYPKENEKWFLVSNFRNSRNHLSQIDSFVCTMLTPNVIDLEISESERKVYFFKKTSITNSTYLSKYPNQFFRHSMIEDLICEYRFNSSGIAQIIYFKKGNYDLIVSDFHCE